MVSGLRSLAVAGFLLGSSAMIWPDFQFGSGVLGGILGAISGSGVGILFGIAHRLFFGLIKSKRETVGEKPQRLSRKETTSAAVRLTRKELIRFALQATPWLSREQVFGPPNKDEIEIVYVPNDHCKESFQRHLAKMPWVSIPFEDDQTKQSLMVHCKVYELPTLAIVDARYGMLIKQDAR